MSLREVIWLANRVAAGTFIDWPGKWISGKIEQTASNLGVKQLPEINVMHTPH